MPVIPVIQRRMSIPGEGPNVLQDVGSAGMVGNAIANLGKTGMDVVGEIMPIIARRNEEMRQQNTAMAVLKAQNAIDADMRAFKQTYDIEANKGNFDPAGLQDFTKTTVDKFKADLDTNYLEKVSDPQQRMHIETYRNAAINHILDHTSVYQANARKDFAKIESDKATDLAAQNARDGVMDMETAIATNRGKLGVLHATGVYSAADMEDKIIKADRLIAASYLDGLIARDPLKAIDEIKSGKYNQFLPEDQYRHFMGKAETVANNQLETTAYSDIASRFGDDYQGAAVEAFKPETLTKYPGMTVNQQQNIFKSFKSLEVEKKSKDEKMKQNNAGIIVDSMLKKSAEGGVFNLNDLTSTLKQMGHDPLTGKLAITPSEELTLKNNIQARIDHLEVTGRRQPDMNEAKWLKYSQLADGIMTGDTTYGAIAKQYANFPDHIIGSLINGLAASEKKMASATAKAQQKQVWDYVNSYKKQFGAASFGELKQEISDVMISGEVKQDQWLSTVQKSVANKWQSVGGFSGLINERLNPGGIGITPPTLKPVPSVKKQIGTQGGKPVYDLGGGKWQVGD